MPCHGMLMAYEHFYHKHGLRGSEQRNQALQIPSAPRRPSHLFRVPCDAGGTLAMTSVQPGFPRNTGAHF